MRTEGCTQSLCWLEMRTEGCTQSLYWLETPAEMTEVCTQLPERIAQTESCTRLPGRTEQTEAYIQSLCWLEMRTEGCSQRLY